jgi:putative transposase
MMPRIARVVATGLPHHITQRGNYQREIFANDRDRSRYLSWIKSYSIKFGVKIYAYCLMTNHVHFVAVPLNENSFAKTFNTAHMRYSQYFNRRIEANGHLFQGRFYSCVLDERHLMAAARYVERNPVRAGLVNKPWDWKWSSARAHIGDEQEIFSEEEFLNEMGIKPNHWREYLNDFDNEVWIKEIRQHTLNGRPLGSEIFVGKLEHIFGRPLKALARGRPRVKV